jgi:Reverse transcriptase (RNA-dependent DNA polymerase)
MLLKTIYGLKQAAYEYWKALLKAIKSIGLTKHKVDPCVYYRWTDQGLNLWASWVDDILSFGSERDVIQGREELKKHFALDEIGEMMEYVGCKIDYNKEEGSVKITQPVLIQSLKDEFDLTGVRESTSTPAAPGSILIDTEAVKVDTEEHYTYRKGVGKLLHLTKHAKEYLGKFKSMKEEDALDSELGGVIEDEF